MSLFIPFSSYESRLFLARRLAGVPGYQYDIDMSKEGFQRQIFSPEEIQSFVEHFQKTAGHEYRRNLVFDEKMYILEINRIDDIKNVDDNCDDLDSMDENRNIFGHYTHTDSNNNSSSAKLDEDTKSLMQHLDLKHPSELLITPVDESNIKMYLNDRKFKELSFRDQQLVKVGIHQARMLDKWYMKPIYESILSVYLNIMQGYHIRQK